MAPDGINEPETTAVLPPLSADALEEITDGPAENRTPNTLIKRCDEGETTAPHPTLTIVNLDELE
nr:hypothetical protein Hi04_10k_c1000_00019 [uncultured bacterium]